GAEGGARVERQVQRILRAVRTGGDRALLAFTRRFDGVALRPAGLRVPAADLAAAYRDQPATVRRDLALAARRIRTFHLRQRERSGPGGGPPGAAHPAGRGGGPCRGGGGGPPSPGGSSGRPGGRAPRGSRGWGPCRPRGRGGTRR